jgi:RNA recognition motif-containing protein
MIINILNLSRKVTESELKKLFEAHGEVESCDLIMDKKTGESKGFAFIAMPDDKQAQAAIKALHETKVKGERIRVKASNKSE